MNYKPQVFVQGQWAGNALVFATQEEAIANARDLMGRWMLVEDYRAIESADEVNYRWQDGKLQAVRHYKLKPGIAAIVHATVNGPPHAYTFVYCSDCNIEASIDGEPLPLVGGTGGRRMTGTELWEALPLELRQVVRAHYGKVFALPVDKRGEYLATVSLPDVVIYGD